MKYGLLAIFICLFLLVSIRLLLYFQFQPSMQNGQEIQLTTRLLNEPVVSGSSVSFHAFYQQRFSAQDILVITQPQNTIHYGSLLTISGKINKRLLDNNRIVVSMRSPVIKADTRATSILFSLLYILRQKLIDLFTSSMDSVSAGLLLGIVFGIKASMPKSFLLAMQQVGITHIIAASGMNVTMVAGFLASVIAFILPRKPGIIMLILSILFYCLLSGLQPSILRATIMVSIVLLSQLFGRQYTAWYALLLTAAVMLLFSPQLLLDVGFQLSFFSTLGILFIQPLFPKNIFSEDIATTIAAQIATLPVLLTTFGQYSLLSILVNALVLWTIPPLMIVGGVGAIVGLFIPVFGRVILYLTIPLLWYFEKVALWFAQWHFSLQINALPIVVSVGYYLLIISGIVLFKQYVGKRSKSKMHLPLDKNENL